MEDSILTYYFNKIKDGSFYLYKGIFWNTVKVFTYFSQYFETNNNDIDDGIISTDYDNEHNVIKITYSIKNIEYILICPIFSNISSKYIEFLLKCEKPDYYILSATLNDEIDITDLLNKVCGPYGTFYYPVITKKIKWILPKEHLINFKNITIIDVEGNDYSFNNLDDILSLRKECDIIPFLNKYEKELLIKKSPYI